MEGNWRAAAAVKLGHRNGFFFCFSLSCLGVFPPKNALHLEELATPSSRRNNARYTREPQNAPKSPFPPSASQKKAKHYVLYEPVKMKDKEGLLLDYSCNSFSFVTFTVVLSTATANKTACKGQAW